MPDTILFLFVMSCFVFLIFFIMDAINYNAKKPMLICLTIFIFLSTWFVIYCSYEKQYDVYETEVKIVNDIAIVVVDKKLINLSEISRFNYRDGETVLIKIPKNIMYAGVIPASNLYHTIEVEKIILEKR